MRDNTEFRPGETWRDTDGHPIQAHGGGILFAEGTYYWYGENKDAETVEKKVPFIGFNAYSSIDLLNWKNLGTVLAPVQDDPAHDLHTSALPERPKVIYNRETRQYVMWAHMDRLGPDKRRSMAHVGVAVSSSPAGPFRYLGSFRPNGCDSRDMTVFQDDDGSAWLLYASRRNLDLHITRLTDDYLGTVPEYEVCFPGACREAPAVYKHNGQYFLLTSGCSGWFPNAAECAVAAALPGPWRVLGNPCEGTPEEINTTFQSQITFVLPVAGRPDCAMVMADRWNPDNLRDSRYVWLPVVHGKDRLRIAWHDRWHL
jgi:beta-xylosidase